MIGARGAAGTIDVYDRPPRGLASPETTMGLLDLLRLQLPETADDGTRTGDPGTPTANGNQPGFGNRPSPEPPAGKAKPGFGNQPKDLTPPDARKPGFGNRPKDLTPPGSGPPGAGKPGPADKGTPRSAPARRESTPYGELVFPYWDSELEAWLDVVKMAIRQAKKVEAYHPELKGALDAFSKTEKKLTAMHAGEPAKVAADITQNTTHEVGQDAATSGASRAAMNSLLLQLKALEVDLGEGRENLRLILRDVEIADKRDQAAKLKEKAEHASEKVDTVLEGIGAAIEAFAHIELGPFALAKPLWDTVTSLVKLFHDNPMAEEAKKLLDEARQMEIENLEDKVKQAERHLRHAEEQARDVLPKSIESAQNYQLQVDRSMAAFDRTSGGSFRFGELRKGIDLTRRAHEAAAHARELLATLTLTLRSVYDPSVPRGSDSAGGQAFRDAVEASLGKIEVQVQVALEVLEKMMVIYPEVWRTAEKALQAAPGTGRGRAG